MKSLQAGFRALNPNVDVILSSCSRELRYRCEVTAGDLKTKQDSGLSHQSMLHYVHLFIYSPSSKRLYIKKD